LARVTARPSGFAGPAGNLIKSPLNIEEKGVVAESGKRAALDSKKDDAPFIFMWPA
jgi:hypothetical protein